VHVTYATPSETDAFITQLGPRPFIVCDMDGNVMKAYSLVPGQTLNLGAGDNPRNQNIPFGTSQAELDKLVEAGVLKEGIFAEKLMDVRLPSRLVDMINRNIEDANPFSIAFLTSRSAEDALTLLKESGVTEPEKVTLIADSGATLYLNGKKIEVRKLSDEEKEFLSGIGGAAPALKEIMQGIVQKAGFDPTICPDLFIEPKGIATNVHYREVLTAYGQEEGSSLDREIGAALKAMLQGQAAAGPRDGHGKQSFDTLTAPATVEVKVAEIHKGHGLEALAQAVADAKVPVSSIIFAGDDVATGQPGVATPGTDYYAMARAPELAAKTGIPFRNIHTHHPLGCDMAGTIAEPGKSPANLAPEYPQPRIDLTVRTPAALGDVIVETMARTRAPGTKPAPRTEAKRAFG
jgi:hypothetical protein